MGKILDKHVVVTNKAKEVLTCLAFLEGFISFIANVLEGNGFLLVVLRTWSK